MAQSVSYCGERHVRSRVHTGSDRHTAKVLLLTHSGHSAAWTPTSKSRTLGLRTSEHDEQCGGVSSWD
jgi:hypothetical protein